MIKQKRIGFLGGTFDPPHLGHLLLAQLAYEQLELDEVRWLPVGEPTHKSRPDLSSAEHRANMVERMTDEIDHMMLDRTDMDRPAPHYTSTLMPLLREQHPHHQFWLLIGGDSLRGFYRWKDPEMILQQCRLGVLARPGYDPDWPLLEVHLPHIQANVDILLNDGIDISSTRLRKWARQSERHALTSDDILDYIKEHNLYQTE